MPFTLTWAGECSAWECDDLGHMNMRHYVYKTAEARASLIIRIGLHDAFKTKAMSSVRVKGFHIKYQSEARPGDPLKIESGLLKLYEETAQLCHIMYHANGRIAATIIETIEHIYLREMSVFPWPSRFKARASEFQVDLPAPAKPRNINLSDPQTGMSLTALKNLGLETLGAGVFGAHEADNTGFITPEAFFGRTTSSIGWYQDGWPELYEKGYRENGGSAALLEARAVFHHRPKVGDAYVYVPGFLGANAYTRSLLHNVLNPVTGENYMSTVGIGCLFNTKTRTLVKTSEDQVKSLNALMRDGLHA